MALPECSGTSSVSNDRCCKDNGGGGDFSAMPVGILIDDIPAEPGPEPEPYLGGDCGCMTVISLPIGLIILRAVTGVVPAVVTEDGVEPE